MKIYTLLVLLFLSFYAFAQNKINSVYTICQGEFDKDKCLYNKLQSKILENYDSKTIRLITKEREKDTISINISLAISDDGNVNLENSFIFSSDKTIDIVNKIILQSLDSFITQVDNSGNPLSEYINTKIYFNIDRSQEQPKLIALPFGEKYSTHNTSFTTIEDVPIFPGCKSAPQDQRRKCFNKKMLDHVISNFRYPKKAQKKKISGRVNVMFIIDKDGTITNIRTFGADKILMNEARRIIKQLPRMTPGKLRGREVRVPFAIPITFRLQ